MAEASLFVMNLPTKIYAQNTEPVLSHINVGTGSDVSIAELAALVAEVTGYQGQIIYDASKPDGTMRKLMDVSRLSAMGWNASIALQDGVRATYQWFLDQSGDIRG
jgi:nucleoside-diphosphate-sugar epimerase